MVITKAIQRIGWRFSEATKKDNTFTVNQNDIDSLNQIAEYVEETQKQQYQANELFAKLYIYLAQKVMCNDKSTVFDNNHTRKIGNLLKTPLNSLVEDLKDSLNASEMYFAFDKARVKDGIIPENMLHLSEKHIENVLNLEGCSNETIVARCAQWKQERADQMKNVMEIYNENPDAILGNVWEFEAVNTAIMAEVNNMINLYK